MCIGRGEFEIDDVKEDTTLASQIDKMSVAIYGPGTSPNSGTAHFYSIGDSINTPIKNIFKFFCKWPSFKSWRKFNFVW